MLFCEQFPIQAELQAIFFFVNIAIGGGLLGCFFASFVCKSKGYDLNHLISNKILMAFVAIAETTGIWLVLCLFVGLFVVSFLVMVVEWVVSFFYDALDWCTVIYLHYSQDLILCATAVGFLLYLSTRSQRFHIPLGKYTTVTLNSVSVVSLHLNSNIKSLNFPYLRAKSSIDKVMKEHAKKILLIDSWLLAKGALAPSGLDELRESYSKILEWRSDSGNRLFDAGWVVVRLIVVALKAPAIYWEYRRLGAIQVSPTAEIQMIFSVYGGYNLFWEYKKTPFIQFVLLMVLHPEELGAANGYNGVVEIRPK